MTRDELRHEYEQMKQQETAIAQQVDGMLEQLTMTRGAIQMLEHLLEQEGAADIAALTPKTSGNHKTAVKEA